MNIIIPTAGRAKTITTHKLIPPHLHHCTTVVTPPGERALYAHTGLRTRVCPCDRLSPKFDWCIDRYTSPEDPYIFFPNDDLKLFYRPAMDSPRLLPITDEENIHMWDSLITSIKTHPWVAISNRSGNNHVNRPHKDVTRSYGFWGVNTNILRKYNLRFGCIESMQDFWMQLALFTRGYANRVFYCWAWDQAKGSNAAGGCSAYRTPEMQRRSVTTLVDAYPAYVKAVQRKTKTGWFNGTPRWDVRVQWQKAYRNSLKFK